MAAQLWIDRTKEFRTPIVADGWSCQTWEVCCCRENGWTKKVIIKISRRLLFIPIFYEWYKKIPYSLSIRLYFDQLINLKSIRKADKSKLSCAILIKIYREVPGSLSSSTTFHLHLHSGVSKIFSNKYVFVIVFVQFVVPIFERGVCVWSYLISDSSHP